MCVCCQSSQPKVIYFHICVKFIIARNDVKFCIYQIPGMYYTLIVEMWSLSNAEHVQLQKE
jgi:hypothetical protein